jgi:hypothetical protein
MRRARDGVVLLADDLRIQDAAPQVERIDGRVDAELRDRAVEHRGHVEVRERGFVGPMSSFGGFRDIFC